MSEDRLALIKAWAARMRPVPGEPPYDRVSTEPIATFQHTKDDYDWLIAEVERLRSENKRLNHGN